MMDATNEAYANNELFRVNDSNGDFTMLVNDLGLIGNTMFLMSLAAAVAGKLLISIMRILKRVCQISNLLNIV